MQPELRNNWLIATALAGWLVYLLAPILTPFVASALLAYIGDPLADRLERLRMPRTVAVLSVFILTFGVIALIVLLVLPLMRTQIVALLDALPGIVAEIERVWLPRITDMAGIEVGEDVGFAAFLSRYSDVAGTWGATVFGAVSRGGGALAAAVISLFLVPIITFYLLRDWDLLVARIGSLVPESKRDTIFELARETDDVLSAFLRGQIMVMLALSVMYSVGLTVSGVSYAIAIGVVAGLVSFVPYLGFAVGIGLASLTVLTQPDPLLPMVGVVATFAIAQFVEGSVLTPKLVGDQIGLHPVMVIFAVAAGGQLFGFFGILLALPVAAVLSVLVRFAYQSYLAEHPEARIIAEPDRQGAAD